MLPLYQFLYDGESHSGALYFVASLQRLEQLKDLIVEFGQYTRAVIADDEFDEFDELGMEDLFLPVTALWQVLGAIDDHERLTPLGWWGLPEAMRVVWAPSDGAPG